MGSPLESTAWNRAVPGPAVLDPHFGTSRTNCPTTTLILLVLFYLDQVYHSFRILPEIIIQDFPWLLRLTPSHQLHSNKLRASNVLDLIPYCLRHYLRNCAIYGE